MFRDVPTSTRIFRNGKYTDLPIKISIDFYDKTIELYFLGEVRVEDFFDIKIGEKNIVNLEKELLSRKIPTKVDISYLSLLRDMASLPRSINNSSVDRAVIRRLNQAIFAVYERINNERKKILSLLNNPILIINRWNILFWRREGR